MNVNFENDLDVELQSHLRENLNHHIWRDNEGHEINVYDMAHSRQVSIYNNLISGKLNVMFQEEWKRVFLTAMRPVL